LREGRGRTASGDLPERWFPEWTPRAPLTQRQVVERAAQISLRCLGVATPRQIGEHFTRGGYPELASALSRLQARGLIVSAIVEDRDRRLPGAWYLHREDLPLLERISAGEWQGRTTLLSPFDNLICDRARTEALFGFAYRVEIYVPKTKRRYGYFSMPILHGDRLIGRVDPTFDSSTGMLRIGSLHAEAGAPVDRATGETSPAHYGIWRPSSAPATSGSWTAPARSRGAGRSPEQRLVPVGY
jgi:uncharacterized protein YcaQ